MLDPIKERSEGQRLQGTRERITLLYVSLGYYHSFEYLASLQYDMSVLLLIMYRPPKYNSEIWSDFAALLSNICID
ncbi:Hypothetical predicted protein [Scomber scombrus]|uniref:Uncharacterized protein n=1 Tax=Scomber scombrus TaxID=13677 RepID=A0AAV1QEV8_SCOSC